MPVTDVGGNLTSLHEQMIAAAQKPLERAVTFPPGAYTDPDHYRFEVERC